MSRICLILTALAALGCTGQAWAEGDAAAGKAKSAVCAACHGAEGNGVNPEWPKLAGQHERYTVAQLNAFKAGGRQNALMSPQAMMLSEQDMEDLAAYYGAQALRAGTADPDMVNAGQRLYRGGNAETGVPACIACHGPHGMGNPLAAIPVISGQYAVYSAAQLRAYAAGQRRSDLNQMMRNIASAMSSDEIEAVSSYLQGLR